MFPEYNILRNIQIRVRPGRAECLTNVDGRVTEPALGQAQGLSVEAIATDSGLIPVII